MLDSIWSFIAAQFHANQFLSGGVVLGLIATTFHQLKAVPGRLYRRVKTLFFIEVQIEDKDQAFLWVVKWLAHHPYSKNRARLLTATTESPADSEVDSRPQVLLSPAKGNHWFFYKNRLLYLYRGKEESGGKDNGNSSAEKKSLFAPELISIRMWGRSRNLITELLEEARELFYPAAERRTTIMIYRYGSWSVCSICRQRPLESVILSNGVMEEMVTEITNFRNDVDWYISKGVPYRLGILLSGPPGSGKSSTISAIASHFNLNLAIINLASSHLNDDELRNMLSQVPKDSMVMIEDIDCIFDQRVGSSDKDNRVSFSGLLNAIDGVAAGEGRILWMTTNHPEKLDPALIRPGRADLKFKIETPDKDQVTRMFTRFYDNVTPEQADRFVNALGDDLTTTSMAGIQGLLLSNKINPEAAITAASTRTNEE